MCDLEDGIIDFRELKTVLETINFEGIGVIEQDMPRATTEQAFTSAKRNLNFLKRLIWCDFLSNVLQLVFDWIQQMIH